MRKKLDMPSDFQNIWNTKVFNFIVKRDGFE